LTEFIVNAHHSVIITSAEERPTLWPIMSACRLDYWKTYQRIL